MRKCVEFQKSAGREKRPAFPLQPVGVETPFQQWGLDTIGEINPSSSSQHKYIITATYYFTRWSEAFALPQINENQVISFLTENIITRFRVLDSIVRDNAKYFSSAKLVEFSLVFGIKLKYSTNYYPQGNGLAESTNKNLINIIKKTIAQHPRCWHTKLSLALWADKITLKASIKNSPFFLVYGHEAIFPTHIFLLSLHLSQLVQDSECPIMQCKINVFLHLEAEFQATQE